jgi:hypothetical protein
MEIQEEKKIEADVIDETELDKSLEESINAVKAGSNLAPIEKEEGKTEEPKAEETKPEEPKAEEPSKPQDEVQKKEYDFKLPTPAPKGKWESDESYEKRVELNDLIQKRKLATTPEQRQIIESQIIKNRQSLNNIGGSDKLINSFSKKNEVETENKIEEEDELIKADRERLKQLGGATIEQVQEILQKERLAVEVSSTLDKFIDRHTELKDVDTREVFFDFVDSNYNWQNKSGKELMTVLELARESMFKPSETIQERVLKGADVQNKVNAMQFPGGTIAKQNYSPEMKSSIDELVATGMSEEKAAELLSD